MSQRWLTSSKVLKSILIVDGERGVVLSELEDLTEIFGKVSDDRVGDLGNVEESVATSQT
jgi:hypothetical protein